jgi:hypothetical protein
VLFGGDLGMVEIIETREQSVQADDKIKKRFVNPYKTIQATVSQEEKDRFYAKCKTLNLSASEKAKELCMAWVDKE